MCMLCKDFCSYSYCIVYFLSCIVVNYQDLTNILLEDFYVGILTKFPNWKVGGGVTIWKNRGRLSIVGEGNRNYVVYLKISSNHIYQIEHQLTELSVKVLSVLQITTWIALLNKINKRSKKHPFYWTTIWIWIKHKI